MLTSSMFGCQHEDWALAFARWNVAYVWALFVDHLLFWLLQGIGQLLTLRLVSLTIGVLFTLLDFLFCVVLNWCSWYCVVKRLGFCGRVGYLCWALLYACLNVGRLGAVTRDVSYWLLDAFGFCDFSFSQLRASFGNKPPPDSGSTF